MARGLLVGIKIILGVLVLCCLPALSAGAEFMEEHVNANIIGGDWNPVHGFGPIGTLSPDKQGIEAMTECWVFCLVNKTCVAAVYQFPEFTGTQYAECWWKNSIAGPLVYQNNTIIWIKKQGFPTGNLSINSTPPDAKIFLDDKDTGFSTPHKFKDYKIGKYLVRLTRPGYADHQTWVTVTAVKTTALDAILSLNQSAVPTTGTLFVSSKPSGAIIVLDSVVQGISPMTVPGLAPGIHSLLITADGYNPHSVVVTITANQTTEYSTSLVENTGGASKQVPGFVAGIGILGITCLFIGRGLFRF